MASEPDWFTSMRREAEYGARREPVTIHVRRRGFSAWFNRLTLVQAFLLGPLMAFSVLGGIGVFVLILLGLSALAPS